MAVSRGALWGALLVTASLLATAQVPAEAATFGVPTQIGTDGQVCTGDNAPAGIGCAAAAVDPPGYLILTGVDDVDDAGDTVHQMRLFIEVTGTTLDVRVFDAGRSGSRDEELSTNTTFTYALYNPAGRRGQVDRHRRGRGRDHREPGGPHVLGRGRHGLRGPERGHGLHRDPWPLRAARHRLRGGGGRTRTTGTPSASTSAAARGPRPATTTSTPTASTTMPARERPPVRPTRRS